ncbi:hypothetical protein FRC07_012374 [Ceratobasidium sp. 392]|nr:hypothetical protein FRC07_012374 [Ceratobasidium sp. 392]
MPVHTSPMPSMPVPNYASDTSMPKFTVNRPSSPLAASGSFPRNRLSTRCYFGWPRVPFSPSPVCQDNDLLVGLRRLSVDSHYVSDNGGAGSVADSDSERELFGSFEDTPSLARTLEQMRAVRSLGHECLPYKRTHRVSAAGLFDSATLGAGRALTHPVPALGTAAIVPLPASSWPSLRSPQPTRIERAAFLCNHYNLNTETADDATNACKDVNGTVDTSYMYHSSHVEDEFMS